MSGTTAGDPTPGPLLPSNDLVSHPTTPLIDPITGRLLDPATGSELPHPDTYRPGAPPSWPVLTGIALALAVALTLALLLRSTG